MALAGVEFVTEIKLRTKVAALGNVAKVYAAGRKGVSAVTMVSVTENLGFAPSGCITNSVAEE
jgi:hypothetical protein